MYSAIVHYVNMALYKCCILLLFVLFFGANSYCVYDNNITHIGV